MLTVQDTGTGIPEHELPHVFERFRRVAGARARTQEGSGIGLALVSDLVKLHGGRIGAPEPAGRGERLRGPAPARLGAPRPGADRHRWERRELCQADAYVQEALRWIPGRSESPAARERAKGLAELPRVLVADDNADMRDYLVRLLEGRYEVEVVGNGAWPSRPPVAVGRTWS